MATLSLKKTTPRVEAMRQESRQPIDDITWRWLIKDYPELFRNPRKPKPLKQGLFKELLEVRPANISKSSLRRVLGRWCTRRQYLESLERGGERYGLSGPEGEVKPHHMVDAVRRLERLEETN